MPVRGQRMASTLRVSRRGALGLGVGGAVAATGLPLVTSTRVNAADDGSATEGAFVVVTDERQVSRSTTEVQYVTDHLSGSRGHALQWGLQRFSHLNPHVVVQVRPGAPRIPKATARRDGGSRGHVALLSQTEFLRYRETGAFLTINDLLPKLRSARRIEEHHAPETFSVRPGQFDQLAFEQHYFVRTRLPTTNSITRFRRAQFRTTCGTQISTGYRSS